MVNIEGRPIICACSEGLQRSVFAVDFLKKNGFKCKLLEGGLESFQEYLLGEVDLHDSKIERYSTRNVDDSKKIAELRANHDSLYNRLLKIDNAVWLIFITDGVEAKKFQRTMDKLRRLYGVEVILLESYNQESVEENIKKLLLGQL